MADVLIRGVDDRAVQRLKDRARRNGRSFQGEAKLLLENAAGLPLAQLLVSARAWRKKLGRRFDDSAALIRQDRER